MLTKPEAIIWQGFPLTKETLASSKKVRAELERYLAENKSRLMSAGEWGRARVAELEGVLGIVKNCE